MAGRWPSTELQPRSHHHHCSESGHPLFCRLGCARPTYPFSQMAKVNKRWSSQSGTSQCFLKFCMFLLKISIFGSTGFIRISRGELHLMYEKLYRNIAVIGQQKSNAVWKVPTICWTVHLTDHLSGRATCFSPTPSKIALSVLQVYLPEQQFHTYVTKNSNLFWAFFWKGDVPVAVWPHHQTDLAL